VLHGLAADKVQVEVLDFLVAVGPGVHDEAVAVFGNALLGSQFPHDGEHFSGDGFVFQAESVVVFDVFVGNDEDVRWRYRVDVPEGGDVFILVDFFAGNLPGNDLAKDAVWVGSHGFSSSSRN